MFDGLSVQYSLKNSKPAKWITQAGQFLFWAVEMATTDNWLYIIARNIFFLLYFTGLVFVATGSLSPESKFPAWGWGIIGFTAFLQYARYVLKRVLIEKAFFDLNSKPAAVPGKVDVTPKQTPIWKLFIPSSLAGPALIPILGGLILLLITNYADVFMNFFVYMKEIFFILAAILIAFGLLVVVIYQIGNKFKQGLAQLAWVLPVLIVMLAALAVAMGWSTAPLKAAGHTILEFERANQAGKAVILGAWSGMEKYVWWTLFLDFPFLLVLTTILWTLWDLLVKAFDRLASGIKISTFCRLIANLTIFAGIADFLENISLMGILSGYAGTFLMPMGICSTYAKFILFGISIALLPVMAIWLWIARRSIKKEDGQSQKQPAS
jgi:hypothetical protein